MRPLIRSLSSFLLEPRSRPLPSPAAWPRATFVALLALSAATSALAHKPSDAYLTLEVAGGQVTQRFDIALRDLDRDLQLDTNDDGQLTWGEVQTRWPQIDALARAALQLRADGQACEGGPPGIAQLDDHSDGRYAVLTRSWQCPAPMRSLEVGYGLFAHTDPSHRGVAQVRGGALQQPAVLVPGAAAHTFDLAGAAPNAVATLAGFVHEGVHHILIGFDHILFLLSLLLPVVLGSPPAGGPRGARAQAERLRPVIVEVMKVVTAFTVAHSITLGLAMFDLVNPPSRWIESVIAASVVLAALNNIFPVVREGRWKLTFLFGLVHGFGFAGALKDLGLSQGSIALPLFGFNLGVELGQLLVVALFLPIAWALRGTPFYRRGVMASGSALIAALAMLWLVERAFDWQLLPGLA